MSAKKSEYSKNKYKEYLKSGAAERLIPEIGVGFAYYYEGLARYFFASQVARNKKVLDLGCGSGFGSFILSKFGKAKSVLGVDFSEDTLDYAKDKYGLRNVKYEIADVQKLAVGKEKYDLIVGFEIIEHISDQDGFLKSLKNLLKSNGLAIISTPNKYTYPQGNPYHVKEFYPEELKKILYKYFKKVVFYYQSFEFNQSIRTRHRQEVKLEEDFSVDLQKTFSHVPTYKNSHYIVAVVSNIGIAGLQSLNFSSQKVDSFDLKQGFATLHQSMLKQDEEINQLQNDLSKHKDEVARLRSQYSDISSSKFFKLWQIYGRIKKVLHTYE